MSPLSEFYAWLEGIYSGLKVNSQTFYRILSVNSSSFLILICSFEEYFAWENGTSFLGKSVQIPVQHNRFSFHLVPKNWNDTWMLWALSEVLWISPNGGMVSHCNNLNITQRQHENYVLSLAWIWYNRQRESVKGKCHSLGCAFSCWRKITTNNHSDKP